MLILDEPANGLDPEGSAGCVGCCAAWAKKGRAVPVSGHRRQRSIPVVESGTEAATLEGVFLRLTAATTPQEVSR